jgi:anti-anti-sigma factor
VGIGLELTPLVDGSGLKLIGELDLATAGDLREALELASAESEVRLDVSELSFIDSSGLRAILTFANSRNGRPPVVLLDPSEHSRRLFEIVQLDRHPKVDIRRRDASQDAA